MDLNTIASVLRPKVAGTWVLHHLSKGMVLDFFIGFSSIASVWGSKGQAHYAAANYFLDAFAQYRRVHGLPGMSINWGPWAAGGMTTPEAQMWLMRMGVKALQPGQAVKALGYLLEMDGVQITVAHMDWLKFKALYEVREKRPLLEQIAVEPRQEVPERLDRRPEIVQRLEEAPPSERQNLLMSYIQGEVAKVLGFAPSQVPEPQQGFFDMGIDSLMAVELKERLEADLGSSLPTTLAFDCPTIEHLTEYLAKEVLRCEFNANVNVAMQQKDENGLAVIAAKLEQLSEEETETLLYEKIRNSQRKN
jgi:acyl carrier protein